MKRALPFILLLLVISCTPTPTPQVVPTVAPPTATLISYQPTFTIPTTIPTASPTSTPVVCDPLSTDYCITDGHFIFQRPIKAPANTFVDTTYPYASTANGKRDPHHGVEFLNKFGTPVYAAADGTVLFAGPDVEAIYNPWSNFYGNMIVLQHADGLNTLYAHLSRVDVEAGQLVAGGDKIGEVGQSGVATGSHLHFEVRRGDVQDYFSTLNPELWLVPNEGTQGLLGVLQISIIEEGGQLIKAGKYTLEYLSLANEAEKKMFYGVTYSADMLNGDENAVMGDMPQGTYRIAFKYGGQLYERRIEVESGKLTQVVFVVK